ncbi:hypothetical protein BZG36_02817 [Bifiguratus adelaidae]|uniref:Condensation domain-containing protein n=1 Tax=Bifiguratus adelaidae TaxID=1938954 RepID=A0A261Y1G8_9FUNG|nr:hypothetical protein BZG36_02817 [Bifiguratus adelaidae]
MTDIEWKETAPGVYERPADEIESFYNFIGSLGAPFNRQQWAITASIKLRFESADVISQVKEAWTTLRYDHPTLASNTDGTRKVYHVGNDEELERWLKETFIVNDVSVTAKQLFSTLQPVKQVTLHLLLKSNELVLQSPHDRLDGIGCILFFDNMLRVLASPRKVYFGDEAKNLSPPLKVAARAPEPSDEQIMMLTKYMEHWVGSLPSVGLAISGKGQIPGATRIRQVTLSENQTRMLVTTAKGLGLTPTHVVHAATILAAKKHGNHNDSAKYASFGLFNMRHQCEPPFSSSKHPVSVYSYGWPVTVASGDFATISAQLKKYYREYAADQDSISVSIPYAKKLKSMLSVPPPHPPTDPILSSLGIVDSRLQKAYGPIEVQDFWFAVDMLTYQVEVFVWTFQGKLTIEACYNEEFHHDASIEEFLAMLKDILFAELKIIEKKLI